MRLSDLGVTVAGAAVLSSVYPYLILKTGYVPGLNVVSGLLTFLILKLLLRRARVPAREANLIQAAMTTAANVGFLAVVLAGLTLLGIPFSPWATFLWLAAGAGIGNLMAVPLRRQMIEVEELPFPHGRATGELLKTLEDPVGPGLRKARALAATGAFAAVFALLREGLRWIPGSVSNAYKVGFEPSLMLAGAGALIGARTAFWLLAASLFMWGWAAPGLVENGVAARTAVAFGMEADLARGSYYPVLMRWTMWPATVLLLCHGFMTVLLGWRSFAASLRSFAAAARGGAVSKSGDLPLKFVVLGVAGLSCVLAAVQRQAFGISPWMTLLAILVSMPLMLVGLRVKGETGIGPISIMASLTQLFFGWVAPGHIAANMATSGTTASVVNSADDLMDDMKTAYAVGNEPRTLTVLQLLVGIPVGALMTTLIYPLLLKSYGFGEGGLAAPTAHKWKGLAELLQKGWEALPPGADLAMIAAALAGAALALLERRWARWTPSAMGVGMAMLLPATVVTPMALGGLLAWAASRKARWEFYLVPVAAGCLGGEALMSLVISLARVFGLI